MESLVLSPQDVENLEAMSDGSTGYFYKMLDYLEKRVEDGVRRGRFSEEAAKADLETALWYSYACNNLDEYESYCRAAQWMAASEGSAEAARCGMWYYRYSCALLYCGRLEEALDYAEKGVAVEPDYVWGWLQLGKLRSHFGDTAGALAAVERHEVTPALEDVVEATIYLSGLGFENGGLAAAHAVNDGFAQEPQAHGMYHGEKVAFGTLVQLVLEKAPQEELEQVLGFLRDTGLPLTLAQLGVKEIVPETLKKVAEAAVVPTQSTKNLRADITAQEVYDAILEADRIGRDYLAR